MSFKKVYLSSLSPKKRVGKETKEKKDVHIFNEQTPNNNTQVESATLGSEAEPVSTTFGMFRKNITEKEVEIKLFILETTRGFMDMNIKEKIAAVLKQSDFKFQEYLFNKIADKNEIKDYDDLRHFIINYCTSKGIENVNKFKEESWSEYLKRIKLIAMDRNINENEVKKNLRQKLSPPHIRMLLYASDLSLNQIIKNIEEYEENLKLMRNSYKRERTFKDDKRGVKCFRCGKNGHKKIDCKVKLEDNYNMVMDKKSDKNSLREDEVEINGFKRYCIFDTGSCFNIITIKLLKKIIFENQPIMRTNSKATLLNNQEIYFVGKIMLKVIYKGKTILDWFYVLEK
ncbi:hypothetical protein DMUE_6048, partial [Dictyocoela muelleri]